MGLDMYLKAEKYVGGWRHGTDGERNEYERLVEMYGMQDFVTEDSPSAFVSFTVGYWRKANQIHSWFVRECQKGVDECQPTSVSIADLKDLREVCLQVLGSTTLVPGEVYAGTVFNEEHPKGKRLVDQGQVMEDTELAEELLAPEDGFFFGSTDYSQYYWEDLQRTVTIVNKCIALDKATPYWSFEYQSSW